jgi:sugar (pentulose or hexulose) kinase
VLSERYLLSWDAGSGSYRCLLVDGQGREVAVSRCQAHTVRVQDVPGSLEFDPQGMWEAFVQLTRQTLTSVSAAEIGALSTTSFRDGVVFLDRQGNALYAGTNRDARAVAQGFEMAQAHGERICSLSGRWPVGTDAAAHLVWMRKFRPEVYQRIDGLLMVSDWLIYRLCGAFCSEPSNACSTLLFDVRQKKWSTELARLLGLPAGIFPPLFSPGTVAGHLSHDAAEALGLHEETPVVVGLADTQAACLACGAVRDGDVAAVAGTTMPLQMTLGEPLMDQAHRTWTGAHALQGLWSLESSAGLAGMAYDWLWQAFGDGKPVEEGYATMSTEAESQPPGAAMALMGPWIADHSRLEFPSRVAFLAPFPMTFETPLTRPRMARAVLENVAFALRGNLAQLEEISGREVKALSLCGGLTRSRLFSQIVADVCQVPVGVPASREASGLGAAMCAAVGAGRYENLEQAAEGMARETETFVPDHTTRTKYRTLYKRWLKTYERLLGR